MYDMIEAVGAAQVEKIVRQFLTDEQKDALADFVRSLELLYLNRSLQSPTSDEKARKDSEKLVQIAITLESQLYLLLNESESTEHFADAYYLIAIIMEYAARVNSKNEQKEFEYWLRAAIAYNYAGYEANSIFCSIQCNNRLIDEGILHDLLKLISLFLARRFKDFNRLRIALSANLQSTFDNPNDTQSQSEYFLKLGCMAVARTMNYFVEYLTEGNQLNEEWQDSDLRSNDFVQKSSNYFLSWVYSRLRYVFLNSRRRSLWSHRDIVPEQVAYALTHHEEPIYELWPSQEQALRSVASQESQLHAILSMPTSSGKTLVAAMILARELLKTNKNAFYVTSLRALVDEVTDFFSKYFDSIGLHVTCLPGDYDSIPHLESLIGKVARVFVLTPEKLDLLWRVNDPRIQSAGVFVFDEVQLVREKGRGLRLELLISKINEIKGHSARIILLSAVIPKSNIAEFVKWLGSTSTRQFETTWTPTRTREGYFFRPHTQPFTGTVMYFRGGDKRKTLVIKNVLPPENNAVSIDAALLAWKYHYHFGPVLVYANRKNETEKIAEKLFELARADIAIPTNPRLLNASKTVRDILGGKFLLPEMITYGIAYHHASLPDEVKHIIQRLARDRDLSVIATTTTLAEGVNLNIKSVIISHPMAGGDRMDAIRLRNLAGRAGRALRDTEGHVILMHPDLADDLLDINRSRIRSRLFSYLESITDDSSLDNDINALEANLIARAYKKEITREDVRKKTRRMLSSTFFYRQASSQLIEKVHAKVTEKAETIVNDIVIQDPNILRVFSETGLGLDSCKILDKAAMKIMQCEEKEFRFDHGEMNWGAIDQALQACIEATQAYLPAEIRNRIRDPISVIGLWISGASLSRITAMLDEGGNSESFRRISYFIYSYVVNDISWAASAFVKLFLHHAYSRNTMSSVDKEWEMFPSYLKYGTNNPAAILLILSRAYEREVAVRKARSKISVPRTSRDWLKLLGIISYDSGNNVEAFSKIKDNLLKRLHIFSIPLDIPKEDYRDLVLTSDGIVKNGHEKLTSVDSEIIHLLDAIKTFSNPIISFRRIDGTWEINVSIEDSEKNPL